MKPSGDCVGVLLAWQQRAWRGHPARFDCEVGCEQAAARALVPKGGGFIAVERASILPPLRSDAVERARATAGAGLAIASHHMHPLSELAARLFNTVAKANSSCRHRNSSHLATYCSALPGPKVLEATRPPRLRFTAAKKSPNINQDRRACSSPPCTSRIT